MRAPKRRWLPTLVFVLALVSLGPALGAADGAAAGTTSPQTDAFTLKDAAPYTEDEFPAWLHSVRRFEVVAVGASPLAWIASSVLYDLGRFGYKAITSAADTATYAPFFFAPANKPGFTTDENARVLIMTGVVSLGIALGDLIIEVQKQKVPNREP